MTELTARVQLIGSADDPRGLEIVSIDGRWFCVAWRIYASWLDEWVVRGDGDPLLRAMAAHL